MADTGPTTKLPPLVNLMTAAVVRHVVGYIGGMLLGAGALQKGDLATFSQDATGLLMLAVAVGWSLLTKKAVHAQAQTAIDQATSASSTKPTDPPI